jgi:hypothetical protein
MPAVRAKDKSTLIESGLGYGTGLPGVDADDLPDQHAANVLLARLDRSEREILAVMLAQAFVGGVHETLVVLHEAEIPPFDDGYEGTPFHDFVGRLDDWPWPDEWSRPLE